MFNRFSRKLIVLLVFNISFLLIDLHSQNAISQDGISTEYISHQEKEGLDVNKINSSVDAGSFYSVDCSIKQLEENMAKMAQELNRLKQHVQFAKVAEQKRVLQIQKLEKEIQKLEKENMKFPQRWLNNSLDNSWTGSSSKMESSDNQYQDVELTATAVVKQAEPAQIPVITQSEANRIQMETQSEATQTVTAEPQAAIPQTVVSQSAALPSVRQDVVVQVVEYKNN